MKLVAMIARLLLGLLFVFSGLNGLFHFVPNPPMPPGLAGQFSTVLIQSHYVLAVSAFQLAGGALLLANRYVPLGLTLLGPVIVNILLFHILMEPKGLLLAIVVAILWGIVAFRHRQSFAGLFEQKPS